MAGLTLRQKLRATYYQRLKGKQYPQQAMRGHMGTLFALVKGLNAKQVIELGVHTGQSTVSFLYGLTFTGGKLWSCDVSPPLPPVDAFLEVAMWDFAQGNTQDPGVIDQSPHHCDILLVDAHPLGRYRDLMTYGDKVRRGGYILVHDMNDETVERQVRRWVRERGPFPCHVNPSSHGLAIIHVDRTMNDVRLQAKTKRLTSVFED